MDDRRPTLRTKERKQTEPKNLLFFCSSNLGGAEGAELPRPPLQPPRDMQGATQQKAQCVGQRIAEMADQRVSAMMLAGLPNVLGIDKVTWLSLQELRNGDFFQGLVFDRLERLV